MLFRVVSSMMIVVMGVTTAAPAQYLSSSRRARDVSMPSSSATVPADTSAAAMPLRLPPRGLDAPIDPATYVIGPGDQFVLFVRPQGMEVSLSVLPEGFVLVPNVGLVRAAGLTINAFRDELKRTMGGFYRGSELYCQLVVPRTFVVYVLGDVRNPGPVEVAAPFRVDAVLDAVGGAMARGSSREVQIREGGNVVRTVDLVRFQRLGDFTQNPMLHEGQSIFVPSRGATCNVTGEVWRDGPLEIVEGETVMDMIRLSGGFTTNALLSEIVLERLSSESSVTVERVDTLLAATLPVRDRDVIVVPDNRSFPGIDYVRVQGGGGRDGRIYLQEGETLTSFRPRFIRLRNDHDLANSRIERHTSEGGVEFIPVDLSRLVEGDTTLSVTLQSGDVINIPRIEDVVFVSGEVVQPGPIEFQRGLPVGRYIAMAGGPTETGSVDKIEIYDDKGNRRGGDRDSVVYRGETILVKRRTGVILGNLFFGLVSVTSLFLSAYAVIESSNDN